MHQQQDTRHTKRNTEHVADGRDKTEKRGTSDARGKEGKKCEGTTIRKKNSRRHAFLLPQEETPQTLKIVRRNAHCGVRSEVDCHRDFRSVPTQLTPPPRPTPPQPTPPRELSFLQLPDAAASTPASLVPFPSALIDQTYASFQDATISETALGFTANRSPQKQSRAAFDSTGTYIHTYCSAAVSSAFSWPCTRADRRTFFDRGRWVFLRPAERGATVRLLLALCDSTREMQYPRGDGGRGRCKQRGKLRVQGESARV